MSAETNGGSVLVVAHIHNSREGTVRVKTGRGSPTGLLGGNVGVPVKQQLAETATACG